MRNSAAPELAKSYFANSSCSNERGFQHVGYLYWGQPFALKQGQTFAP